MPHQHGHRSSNVNKHGTLRMPVPPKATVGLEPHCRRPEAEPSFPSCWHDLEPEFMLQFSASGSKGAPGGCCSAEATDSQTDSPRKRASSYRHQGFRASPATAWTDGCPLPPSWVESVPGFPTSESRRDLGFREPPVPRPARCGGVQRPPHWGARKTQGVGRSRGGSASGSSLRGVVLERRWPHIASLGLRLALGARRLDRRGRREPSRRRRRSRGRSGRSWRLRGKVRWAHLAHLLLLSLLPFFLLSRLAPLPGTSRQQPWTCRARPALWVREARKLCQSKLRES